MSDSELLGAIANIEANDQAVTSAVAAHTQAIADAKPIAKTALLAFLATVPAEATYIGLPAPLATGIASVWAAAYKWRIVRWGWHRLYDFVDGLLEDTGWTTVLEGTSNPDPYSENPMGQEMVIRLRRVVRFKP